MSNQRTHYWTASDGVRIGGTVYGEGSPIVFLHGAYGDGDLDWRGVLPFISDSFACFLPSWRGRGLSTDHPDLSYGRRVDDVVDYVASLDEPTGLVGWSGGASLALAAAGQSRSVKSVALFEPTMASLMSDQEREAFGRSLFGSAALRRGNTPDHLGDDRGPVLSVPRSGWAAVGGAGSGGKPRRPPRGPGQGRPVRQGRGVRRGGASRGM